MIDDDDITDAASSLSDNFPKSSEHYYEYLGFPTILYRHPCFDNDLDNQDAVDTIRNARLRHFNEIGSTEGLNLKCKMTAKLTEEFIVQQARLQAAMGRWYYGMDAELVKTRGVGIRKFAAVANPSSSCGRLQHTVKASDFPENNYLEYLGEYVPFMDAVKVNILDGDWAKTSLVNKLDTNFVTATEDVDRQKLLDLTAFYDKERRDYADPAYQAPVLLDPTAQMAKEAAGVRTDEQQDHGIQRKVPDGSLSPRAFGNCISAGTCQCLGCAAASMAPVRFVIHPVGILLQRLRVSFLPLPCGIQVVKPDNPPSPEEELALHDRLLQLVPCGEDPLAFAARTPVDITVFSLSFPTADVSNDSCCSGRATFQLLHRIHHVSWNRHELSFRPIHTTANPAFASRLTPSRIVTAYQCSNGNANTIRTVSSGSSSLYTEQDYTVRNLKEIAQVEYHRSHPMLLWAVATSYIRPALVPAPTRIKKDNCYQHLGLGSALYTVDLRQSESAVFQWSPSAEQMLAEGQDTLSNIAVDPRKDHRLWATSELAQTTWELDSRMPCRSVCSYSLPFLADYAPRMAKQQDYVGGGMIYSFPDGNEPSSLPVLAVSKRPHSNGVHCYHRMQERPLLQKKPTEIIAGPIFPARDISAVRSSRFCLPEVSGSLFYCGLASFESNVSSFLGTDEIPLELEDKDAVLCTVTLTNKGDLHSQTMLKATSLDRKGVECQRGFLAGASIVELPGHVNEVRSSGWNVLPLLLSNDEPITRDAIRVESDTTKKFISPDDLEEIKIPETPDASETFPALEQQDDASTTGILDSPEDLEFDVGTGSVRLGRKIRPQESSRLILPKSTWTSNSYMPFFDDARRAGIETNSDELRSDLTKAALKSAWSSSESDSDGE